MIWDLMWGEAVEIAAFEGKAKGGIRIGHLPEWLSIRLNYSVTFHHNLRPRGYVPYGVETSDVSLFTKYDKILWKHTNKSHG